MGRDIFDTPEVLGEIKVITTAEESKYSDVPGWSGQIGNWTEKAVILLLEGPGQRDQEIFFPFSQLRQAEDGQSIYASNWILDQKMLG